ncbi:YsnF/AvaK domain-containing protein [Paenibacillus antri]|uniref:YsnF/AvaK domain-containing protein n=1 Tax=Paenibacillus antri TaxID=2582848 RepID=A0A5R9FZR3_9BACL|nr:YsnF/AvaK domain-containing protein [Paenibacillus antri]TLS49557.1 YsnF/AvaK domain-containing protein [Paenibacillus antri]
MAFFNLFSDDEEEENNEPKAKRGKNDVKRAEDRDADVEIAEEIRPVSCGAECDVTMEAAENLDTDMLDDAEFGEETGTAVAEVPAKAATLRLKAEELEVTKNMTQAGEVILHKDIVEEQKTVSVPVVHEQVVIERKTIHREPTSETIGKEETIHIPVNEEKVDVRKRTVVIGEVSTRKREVTETESVSEKLRREEVRVDVKGDTTVIDDQVQG